MKNLLKEIRADIQILIEQHCPIGLAQDRWNNDLKDAFGRLSHYWLDKLDGLAPTLAEQFVRHNAKHTERAFQAALKQAGFTVRFGMTQRSQEAFSGVVGANVGLIRSIGQEYLSKVESVVWQSVNAGYDMGKLAQELKKSHGISQRRAAFIARDQTNKAKAVIEKSRREELGITEAVWLHSHAGKEPRPSHVNANGKRFQVARGMYLDGEWVQPGEMINCRCNSRAVIKGFNA